jgi:hypothetical protein
VSRLPGAIAVVLLVAGCALLADRPRAGPYPQACASFELSEQRCAAVVGRAASLAEVSLVDPALTEIRLEPGDGSRREIAVVRFLFADGRQVAEPIACAGVGSPSDRVCTEGAGIFVGGGINHDVPCVGEPPAGCATLPPTPRPASVAAADELRLDRLAVPIDRTGRYRLEVGSASLPDGAISEMLMTIEDPRPLGYWIDDGVRLVIEPDIPGRPPVGSVYRDPFDGPEPVHVFLEFEVTELLEPSTLVVRGIVVR